MNHDLFDWDNVNIAHIALHHVVPDEAEEALTLAPIELDYETVNGEERDRLIGITAKGRLIAVVITVRYDKIKGGHCLSSDTVATTHLFQVGRIQI